MQADSRQQRAAELELSCQATPYIRDAMKVRDALKATPYRRNESYALQAGMSAQQWQNCLSSSRAAGYGALLVGQELLTSLPA